MPAFLAEILLHCRLLVLLGTAFYRHFLLLHRLPLDAVPAHQLLAIGSHAHHAHCILIAALVAFYFDISVFVDIPTFLNQNFFNGVNI